MARTVINKVVRNIDEKFVKALEECNKLKVLSEGNMNEIIVKYFPKLEFGTKTMKNYLKSFIPYYLSRIKQDSLEDALDLIDPILYRFYAPDRTMTQLASLDNNFSQLVRNPLKKKYGKDSQEYELSRQLTALTDEDKGLLIKYHRERLEKRNEEKIEYDPEEVLKNIADNINSPDVFKRAISLLLASGSRPIELYVKSTYTIPEKTDKGQPFPVNWIRQQYVAKDRGDKEQAFVIKPILYIKPKEFIRRLEEVREELREMYGSLVDKDDKMKTSVMNKANEAAKEIFNYTEDFVQYTSRPLYGLVSYDLYGRNKTVFANQLSENEWFKLIYGHKNLETSLNYRRFILKYPKKSSEEVKIQLLKQDVKIEAIETRLDENQIPNQMPNDNVRVEPETLRGKQYLKLKKIMDETKIDGRMIPASRLETLVKGTLPRSVVRAFHKSYKLENFR